MEGLASSRVDTLRFAGGESDRRMRSRLGMRGRHRVIAVFGTTSTVPGSLAHELSPVVEAIVAAAARANAVIVTGGTDAGMIRLVGRACAGRARLIGVVPEGALNDAAGGIGLEEHHDHVVLADGSAWGDETPQLERVIDAIAAGSPVVAVLLGGGDVSQREVDGQLHAGRTVVVVAGSGRLADSLATTPPDAGDVVVVDAADGSLAIGGLLSRLLSRRTHRRLRDRVAALSALPPIRRPRPSYEPFLGYAARVRYPKLADAITDAEEAVRDAYIATDTEALEEQRRFRSMRLATVLVGAATTTFAAVQVAIPDTTWPAITVTTLAAAGTAITAAARRGGSFEGYLRQRTAAEGLKSAYFYRLTLEPLGDKAAEARRRQEFAQNVARLRHGKPKS